jgi:hypothetical protein
MNAPQSQNIGCEMLEEPVTFRAFISALKERPYCNQQLWTRTKDVVDELA